MGKIFNKGLTDEDKKEGLLKSVKNIGGKNKELLKEFSAANKCSKAAINESDFSYNSKYAFYTFYRDSEKLKRMVSIDSKLGKLKKFCEVLIDFKNLKPVTIETKTCKNRIMNNVNQLYNKYLHTYKKNTIVRILAKKIKKFLTSLK